MESESMTRKHLRHVFMDCMKEHPDAVCQIDAATGEEETRLSVLTRSIRLAKCLRKFGLKSGDVLSLGGRNHLDLHIPYYAALLIGLPISGVDPYFKFDEIKSLLTVTRPKIAFCQQESYDDYIRAFKDIGLDTHVITFDGPDNNLKQFIESYEEDGDFRRFEPENFDTNKVFAFLISTSGTTGELKVAAFTHAVFMRKLDIFRNIVPYKDIGVRIITLTLSPVQWVSGIVNALALPLMNSTKLQTSKPDDEDHIIEMINKYKPTSCLVGPSMLATLLQRKKEVDWSCLRMFNITGSKVFPDVLQQLQRVLHKDARVLEAYGLTEMIGLVTFPIMGTPLGSCGVPTPPNVIKLVDPESEEEITAPYVTGELWVKGPGFTEYYNNPQATAAAFSKDGYCKSGDLLYRDENNFYYFVDRIKSLIKYRKSHVLPAELEEVIQTHRNVQAVCVCGVAHKLDGQQAAACIKLRPGCHVSEKEIKDLVASKLSKRKLSNFQKHLHGGVLFVSEMPMTSSGKLARAKIQKLLNESLQL